MHADGFVDPTVDAVSPLTEELRPAVDSSASSSPDVGPVDLDGIERDLAGVEAALGRLDDGTYWTDEVTGDSLPAELLERHPTARRRSEP